MKLDAALRADLLSLVEGGLFKEDCAAVKGITPDQLDKWLETGLSPGAPPELANFAREFRAREANLKVEPMLRLKDAAAADANAAARFLAMRFPEQYGPKPKAATHAGSLQPTDDDLASEEEMVRLLLRSKNARLVQILEEEGFSANPGPSQKPAVPPPDDARGPKPRR
jgi:hypothetical protein